MDGRGTHRGASRGEGKRDLLWFDCAERPGITIALELVYFEARDWWN
jgi:hypothetical protein